MMGIMGLFGHWMSTVRLAFRFAMILYQSICLCIDDFNYMTCSREQIHDVWLRR